MDPKKLYRSNTNRFIAGVCGGIADYFGCDPTIIRIIYVLLTLSTAFSGILIYIILCFIIPEKY